MHFDYSEPHPIFYKYTEKLGINNNIRRKKIAIVGQIALGRREADCKSRTEMGRAYTYVRVESDGTRREAVFCPLRQLLSGVEKRIPYDRDILSARSRLPYPLSIVQPVYAIYAGDSQIHLKVVRTQSGDPENGLTDTKDGNRQKIPVFYILFPIRIIRLLFFEYIHLLFPPEIVIISKCIFVDKFTFADFRVVLS